MAFAGLLLVLARLPHGKHPNTLTPAAFRAAAASNAYAGNSSNQEEARSKYLKMNAQGCSGFTKEDVAKAWMEAISPISAADAAAMCVPAVAIAAGESYDVPGCAKKFNPTIVNSAGAQGLWQIKNGFSWDAKEQARTVYNMYTSNNADYGCLSKWCKQRAGCSEPHYGIGQENSVLHRHVFCQGMWTGPNGHYQNRLNEIGGAEAVKRACTAAGAGLATSAKTSAASKAGASAQHAQAKKASKPGCVSILENVPNHWCVKNCKANNCPATVCKCPGQARSASAGHAASQKLARKHQQKGSQHKSKVTSHHLPSPGANKKPANHRFGHLGATKPRSASVLAAKPRFANVAGGRARAHAQGGVE